MTDFDPDTSLLGNCRSVLLGNNAVCHILGIVIKSMQYVRQPEVRVVKYAAKTQTVRRSEWRCCLTRCHSLTRTERCRARQESEKDQSSLSQSHTNDRR